jgi:uncharacterized membrane protein
MEDLPMPFCGKCGVEIKEDTAFCQACGNPVSSGTTAAKPDVPSPPPPAAGSSISSNVAALLTYILGFITGIIFLVLEPYKNDKFVRFHAFQSIFLSVAYLIFWFFWSRIWWAIFSGVGFFWIIASLISVLVSLGVFVLWIFLMYKAYNNERFKLPVIGDLAAKQAG